MRPGRGLVVLIAIYAGLLVGGLLLGRWFTELVAFDVRPHTEPQAHTMIMTATAVYILVSAAPFVPGAEIGLGLMALLGSGIVPLVYLSTVLALSLAYLIGRLIPVSVTAAGFGMLGLRRARDLVLQLAPLDNDARLKLLTASAPRRIVPFLLRHRYVMLALAFNLPGNTLLGGGGGIALAAGMSGLYKPVAYLATVVLAVAPVPLLFLITGVRP